MVAEAIKTQIERSTMMLKSILIVTLFVFYDHGYTGKSIYYPSDFLSGLLFDDDDEIYLYCDTFCVIQCTIKDG